MSRVSELPPHDPTRLFSPRSSSSASMVRVAGGARRARPAATPRPGVPLRTDLSACAGVLGSRAVDRQVDAPGLGHDCRMASTGSVRPRPPCLSRRTGGRSRACAGHGPPGLSGRRCDPHTRDGAQADAADAVDGSRRPGGHRRGGAPVPMPITTAHPSTAASGSSVLRAAASHRPRRPGDARPRCRRWRNSHTPIPRQPRLPGSTRHA